MITTREGREIMAEALRAVASVLDNRNDRDQDSAGGGARQLGEVMDQGMLTSDPSPTQPPPWFPERLAWLRRQQKW
jgi:hypothetical protein